MFFKDNTSLYHMSLHSLECYADSCILIIEIGNTAKHSYIEEIKMKASLFFVTFLSSSLTIFALKPHLTCLKSVKGKLCLKLSIRNYASCVSKKLQIAEVNHNFCAVGTNVCTSRPRICSGYNHLEQQVFKKYNLHVSFLG